MAVTDAQKYASEFLGTFLLVLVVGFNVATGSPWGPTSIAFTLAAAVYALAPISGANFNPAVSLALAQQGVLTYQEATMYVASQAAGGATAGLVVGFCISPEKNMLKTSVGNLINMCVVEYLYTWLLCFVVLNVAASKSLKGNQFFGFAIGLCVVAGGYAAGSISGGNMNPSVSLGLAVSNFSLSLLELPLFIVSQLAGGFFSVVSFHIVRPEEKPAASDSKFAPAELARKIEGYFPAKLTAEFLGAAILVLTVGLNVCSRSIGGVWSIAASLMVMIFSLGDVSGAHFNPAVTAAVVCVDSEKMTYKEAGEYALAQLAGGGAGAALYMLLMLNISGDDNTFPVMNQPGYSSKQAFLAEFVGTFLLAFVVLCVGRQDIKEYAGFAIGACIVGGGSAMGGISGGLLNPAVTAGAAVVNLDVVNNPTVVILFALAQLLGGVVAATVYKNVTHVSEFEANAREQTLHGVDSTKFIMIA